MHVSILFITSVCMNHNLYVDVFPCIFQHPTDNVESTHLLKHTVNI